MPDELTVAIQEAIAWARERCGACTYQSGVDLLNHTCDGDLAIVERLARAAVGALRIIDQRDTKHDGTDCGLTTDKCRRNDCVGCVEAEIERQFALREGSERGKE